VDLNSILRKKKERNPTTRLEQIMEDYERTRDQMMEIIRCIESANTDDEKIACLVKGFSRLMEELRE